MTVKGSGERKENLTALSAYPIRMWTNLPQWEWGFIIIIIIIILWHYSCDGCKLLLI
jgi:hypothetical protein